MLAKSRDLERFLTCGIPKAVPDESQNRFSHHGLTQLGRPANRGLCNTRKSLHWCKVCITVARWKQINIDANGSQLVCVTSGLTAAGSVMAVSHPGPCGVLQTAPPHGGHVLLQIYVWSFDGSIYPRCPLFQRSHSVGNTTIKISTRRSL